MAHKPLFDYSPALRDLERAPAGAVWVAELPFPSYLTGARAIGVHTDGPSLLYKANWFNLSSRDHHGRNVLTLLGPVQELRKGTAHLQRGLDQPASTLIQWPGDLDLPLQLRALEDARSCGVDGRYLRSSGGPDLLHLAGPMGNLVTAACVVDNCVAVRRRCQSPYRYADAVRAGNWDWFATRADGPQQGRPARPAAREATASELRSRGETSLG